MAGKSVVVLAQREYLGYKLVSKSSWYKSFEIDEYTDDRRDSLLNYLDEIKPKNLIYCGLTSDNQGKIDNSDLSPLLYNNSVWPIKIWEYLAEKSIRLVYISTSQIYGEGSGLTEKQIPYPISHYGVSAYLAESSIRNLLHNYVILNLAPVYGPEKRTSYIHYVIGACRAKTPILAMNDVFFSPLYVDDAIGAIQEIEKSDKVLENYNLEGPRMLSQVELAIMILHTFDLNGTIIPVTQYDMLTAKNKVHDLSEFWMPHICQMNCSKLYRHFKPNKRTSIERGLEEIKKQDGNLRDLFKHTDS